jgi:hypothetical protein
MVQINQIKSVIGFLKEPSDAETITECSPCE